MTPSPPKTQEEKDKEAFCKLWRGECKTAKEWFFAALAHARKIAPATEGEG